MYENKEHEKQLLSCLLCDNDSIDNIQLTEQDFASKSHQIIFREILNLVNKGSVADYITLSDNCTPFSIDPSYIASLETPTAANIKYYNDSIIELSRKRKLDMISYNIQDGLKKDTSSEIMATVEEKLTNLHCVNQTYYNHISQCIHPTVEKIEQNYHLQGKCSGISSGFKALDGYTSGFQNSELIVLGARPSIGKTAFALSITNNMCKAGVSVGWFSSEMAKVALSTRLISNEGRIPATSLKDGSLRESEFVRMTDTCSKLYNYKLIIDDTPNIKYHKLLSGARRMKREGVQIIIIDYLTLIGYENSSIPRHERVGLISKGLKELGRTLNIPIIVLSQVTRDTEGKPPTLANLRQSGEIEEDADTVILMHRGRDEQESMTDFNVVKQREGATGTFQLNFIKKYITFHENEQKTY